MENDEKSNSKLFLFSVCVFSFLVAVRVLLIKDKDIVNGMAILNVLALDYIVFAINYESFVYIQKKLKSTSLPVSVIKRKVNTLFILLLLAFVVICVIGLVYSLFYSHALINDIIAIVALFVSIEDKVLSKLSVEVMKKIIKI